MKDCNAANIPIDPSLKLYKVPEEKKVDSTFYKQIVGNLMYLDHLYKNRHYVFCELK